MSVRSTPQFDVNDCVEEFAAAPPIGQAFAVTVVTPVAVAVVPDVPEPFVVALTSIGVVLSTPLYAQALWPLMTLEDDVTVIDAPSVPSHTL